MGVPLPDSTEGLPPELEFNLSQLLAQAAPQVLAQSQALMAQQQAQQNAQDPLLQLQQQELQIKQAEVDRKSKKDAADAAAKADEIRLRETEINNRQELEGTRLGVDIQKDKAQAAAKQEFEGVRMGVDIAKHKTQMAQQPRGVKQ